MGKTLLGMVAKRSDCPTLSVAADMLDRIGLPVPNYGSGGLDHPAIRLKELQERADNGDRFAAAMLNGGSLAEDPVD